MRVPAFSLLLFTAGGLLAGWGFGKWMHLESAPRVRFRENPTPVPSNSPTARPAAAPPELSANGGTFPGVADPQVLAALRSTDLIAAVKDIMARSEEDHCADTRLIQLVESLPESRLAELPALLAANLDNEYIIRFVLTPWAERQPRAALAWAVAQPSTENVILTSALTGLTRKDPSAALAWTLAQPLTVHTRALQSSLIETLSETDPARALAVLNDNGWIATNSLAVVKLVKNWGSQDPAGALAGLRSMMESFKVPDKARPAADPSQSQSSSQFNSLLGALLHGASSRSSAEMEALLKQLTPQEAESGAPSIVRDYLMIHPEATAALLTNPQPGPTERAFLVAMAEKGAGGLVEKMSGFQDPALRQELLQAMLRQGFYTTGLAGEIAQSPAAQKALLQVLAEAPESRKPFLASSLVQVTADRVPDLAVKVWNQLSPATQEKEGSVFLLSMATKQPDSALALWQSSPPAVQANSLRGLVAGMADKNPQGGVSLALQQSDPELRHDALAVALAYWGERAPQAAAAELERLAPQLDLAAMERYLAGAALFKSGSATSYRSLNNPTVQNRLKSLISRTAP